ncbi:hypothetical protein Moror_10562 [Moniliophthora roreri MCA 2997]|uniref:F-box domain-containing protein n=1 Tax=Moniliophthora roreri (strain MCA 2997) TaxID=1381753 RepID=V2XG84_MONRO|nr:hypothetical protein Moror_10562 [Moniliophthora roreri MCA 2997]
MLRHTASPSDQHVIEQWASDTEKELLGYQAEIDRLRVSLAYLEHKRDRLQKQLSQCRSLLSPVHRLPPEILGNIFTMFNDLPEEERWLQSSVTAPALAVSRTCGRWRDIALSIPSVWSSIAIRFVPKWDIELEEYRRLNLITRLFLDRSRTSPLRLNLYFDALPRLEESDEDTIIPVLKTLVQHSERWHTVELQLITQPVIAHEVFDPIAGHLPILTNLILFSPEGEGSFAFRCNLFRDCPALTSISCELAGPLTVHCPLPWGQIRSLEIANTDATPTIEFALFFPNVEQLAIQWCGRGEAYTGGQLLMLGVTSLSIAAEEEEEAYFAFKHLTLRQLSTLDVSGTTGDVVGKVDDISWRDWDEQPVVDFFNRSGCIVTSLSFKSVPISDEQLIQLLRLMPALSYLHLEESSIHPVAITNRTITRRFLQKLTFENQFSSPPFLPKLTDIGLVLHEDGLADTVLPNALISRWIADDSNLSKVGVACIKSANVVFINESEETIKVLTSRLRLLRNAGIWVTVARKER